MSKLFFVSDPHLGHENILYLSKETRVFSSIKEHDDHICNEWEHDVGKRDTVWVLGDLGIGKYPLDRLRELPGNKILIRGNHDEQPLSEYLRVFSDIYSMVKFKGYWLTHCPMHPNELWGKRNIHGHVHSNTVKLPDGTKDDRYVNLCMENNAQFDGKTIVPFEMIQQRWPPKLS
jgi:calcineurin-like phosphoesterase family protein